MKLSFEPTLMQWATSKWTLLFARAAMVVTPFLIGGLAWVVFMGAGDAKTRVTAVEATLKTKLPAIEASVSDVSTTQIVRAADSEAFQREVRGLVADIKTTQRAQTAAIAEVKQDVYNTAVDVGVIKRLVVEMRDAKAASLPIEPGNPHAAGRAVVAAVMLP